MDVCTYVCVYVYVYVWWYVCMCASDTLHIGVECLALLSHTFGRLHSDWLIVARMADTYPQLRKLQIVVCESVTNRTRGR